MLCATLLPPRSRPRVGTFHSDGAYLPSPPCSELRRRPVDGGRGRCHVNPTRTRAEKDVYLRPRKPRSVPRRHWSGERQVWGYYPDRQFRGVVKPSDIVTDGNLEGSNDTYDPVY